MGAGTYHPCCLLSTWLYGFMIGVGSGRRIVPSGCILAMRTNLKIMLPSHNGQRQGSVARLTGRPSLRYDERAFHN